METIGVEAVRGSASAARHMALLMATTALVGLADSLAPQTALAGEGNPAAVAPGSIVQYWDGAGPANDGVIQGGKGTWNAGNANWTTSDGTAKSQWASSTGIFAGAAGAVTLADTEAFQILRFSTSGYGIAPSTGNVTLTPTGAAVLSADPGVTAGIEAPLVGAGSITKTGTGTIQLTGSSTYTGGTTIAAGTLQLGASGDTGSILGDVTDNGTLAFNRLKTAAFAGTISGTGALVQLGGLTVLTAANTYSGGTTVGDAGTLQIGYGGTTGSIKGDVVVANGTLSFDRSDAVTFPGTISGGGAVAQVGTGSLELDAANTYTGATVVAAGTLIVGNNSALGDGSGLLSMSPGTTLGFATGANYTVVNNAMLSGDTTIFTPTGHTETLSGNIADGGPPGALKKTGAGTLLLTGTSTYTGPTDVVAGTLVVDGSIKFGNMEVEPGATLAGSGTISLIDVRGTLAPGSGANGTLHVDSPFGIPGIAVQFAPGSFYSIAVTPGTSTQTIVTGGANLGGTVVATFAPGSYAAKQYTILSAAAGVYGSFDALAMTNLPTGFKAKLAYDTNDAYLDLTATSMTHQLGVGGLSQNELAVGRALNTYFANGGALPPDFVGLFGLKGPALARKLSTLSGEGITGAQNVADRSSSLFTSTITDQTTLYGDGGGAANSVTLTEAPAGSLGLARPPVRELADVPATAQPVAPIAPVRTWRAWATGFGGVEDIQGDAAVGSSRQDNALYGGSFGVDYQLTPSALVGIAVGGSDGTFQVPMLGTSGSSTGGHAALYELAAAGPLYGAASTAFSYFTNHSYRSGLAGTERGVFDSYEVRQRVEAGRHVAVFGGTLTPFAALEVADLHSDGFRETSLTGANVYALDVQGQDHLSVPVSLGARWQQRAALGNGLVFAPAVQIDYVHEFSPLRQQTASFASLPGSVFLVDGAGPDYNAVQVKVGGSLALGASSELFANFDGEFAGHDQLYAGKGGFKIVW